MTTARSIELRAEPLTATAFAPFGDVIEARDPGDRTDDLASVSVGTGGKPKVSVLVTKAGAQLPLNIARMERHPLGSQAFVPMAGGRFFVVVAEPGAQPDAARVRAFFSNGRQGINYKPGTWHHSFIAAAAGETFLILERGGPEANCEFWQPPVAITVVGESR